MDPYIPDAYVFNRIKSITRINTKVFAAVCNIAPKQHSEIGSVGQVYVCINWSAKVLR